MRARTELRGEWWWVCCANGDEYGPMSREAAEMVATKFNQMAEAIDGLVSR